MIRQTLIISILIFCFCSNIEAKENCKYLTKFDNDLWVVDNEGQPVKHITFIGENWPSATWSPDGEFIAFASYGTEPPNGYGFEKAIVIMNNKGQEVTKIVVEPKSEDWVIRYIERIVWRTPNILWAESNAGKDGGFIDIWKLDPTWRRPAKHEKRIEVFNNNCEISPNNKYMVCDTSTDDTTSLEIFDNDKKEIPEADTYFDKKPRKVDLKQIKDVDNIRFSSDSADIIITGVDKKYKLNMKTNKLSKIKALPAGVKIKTIPQRIKVKKDDKEYQAEVFDMFCNESH